MSKAPLALVKEKFNDKAGLISAVQKLASDDLWTDRLNKEKGLEHVSNAKLLRLHDVLSSVKKEFGSRKALIDGILKSENRSKDEGLRARYEKQSTPRLWDRYQSVSKRAKAS